MTAWHKRSAEQKARDAITVREYQDAANAHTSVRASKAHEPWSSQDDELLLNSTEKLFTVAIQLGRSYSAVNMRLMRLRRAQREETNA